MPLDTRQVDVNQEHGERMRLLLAVPILALILLASPCLSEESRYAVRDIHHTSWTSENGVGAVFEIQQEVILITASGGKTTAATFKGLRPGGVSFAVGVGPEPIEITSMDLIFAERKVAGSLTGNPATGDATLRFSALSGVSPMIETVPLDQAVAAYTKMMAGNAHFRMVLVTENGASQSSH